MTTMVSAVVLTKDSADTLRMTLRSLVWCSEIVVIDDYSKDSTVEIAQEYTASVYKRRLESDFSAQRNFGLSKARFPWVLFVDSDEVVSKDLKEEIIKKISKILPSRQAGKNQKFKIKRGSQIFGFFIKRIDVFFNKKLRYGETGNIRLLRLAKKDAGVWIRPVHEVWKVKGRTETLHAPLLHSPHPDVAQFLSHIHWYSTIYARYLYENKQKSSVFEILCYPLGKFFYNYIIRLGFLDGIIGCIVAFMMSFHSFLVRAKLWLLWQKN